MSLYIVLNNIQASPTSDHMVSGFFGSLIQDKLLHLTLSLKYYFLYSPTSPKIAHQPCYFLVIPWDRRQGKRGHTFPPYAWPRSCTIFHLHPKLLRIYHKDRVHLLEGNEMEVLAGQQGIQLAHPFITTGKRYQENNTSCHNFQVIFPYTFLSFSLLVNLFSRLSSCSLVFYHNSFI